MIERKLIRELRSPEGELLMKWVIAAVPEICDECSTEIKAGEKMATREVPYPGWNRMRHFRRDYCAKCGALLEDSMVTTEMVR